jgi:hypothetical protein
MFLTEIANPLVYSTVTAECASISDGMSFDPEL